VRKSTGSFVGPKSAVAAPPIALRVGDVRAFVDRDRFVLGRSAKDAHFPLRDAGVSRQHAIVERAGAEWVIVDMASTNGVHVNGVRVTRAAIRAGDVVEIGPFAIAVEPA
jgi:pSer/pThr/pTyr-binding forkhead associated (FHA) protein